MRGRHRAHVGLLETGVDFACRLGKLAPRGHIDRPFVDGPFVDRSVDRAGHDYHYAARRSDDASSFGHDSSGIAAAGQQSAEVSPLRRAAAARSAWALTALANSVSCVTS